MIEPLLHDAAPWHEMIAHNDDPVTLGLVSVSLVLIAVAVWIILHPISEEAVETRLREERLKKFRNNRK